MRNSWGEEWRWTGCGSLIRRLSTCSMVGRGYMDHIDLAHLGVPVRRYVGRRVYTQDCVKPCTKSDEGVRGMTCLHSKTEICDLIRD